MQVDVLRRSTFDALRSQIEGRPGFYQLVHFDDHGEATDKGYLIFEGKDGGKDRVSGAQLGGALMRCAAPWFVLNACQSATGGTTDPFSSVAAQLMVAGAQGVVAMSYAIYTTAAALFIGRFYASLAAHASLGTAVAAAPRVLYEHAERESVAGPMALRDWIVPTLSAGRPGCAHPSRDRYAPLAHDSGVGAVHADAVRRCPSGRFGFVGRDNDVLRIERALCQVDTACVLLTGMRGIGKTELAFGFARWYAETGGCPDGVSVVSLREGATVDRVVRSVDTGDRAVSRLSGEDRRQHVIGYLRSHRCLLLLDSLETGPGFARAAGSPARDIEWDAVGDFLRALNGGQSRVLVAMRADRPAWRDLPTNGWTWVAWPRRTRRRWRLPSCGRWGAPPRGSGRIGSMPVSSPCWAATHGPWRSCCRTCAPSRRRRSSTGYTIASTSYSTCRGIIARSVRTPVRPDTTPPASRGVVHHVRVAAAGRALRVRRGWATGGLSRGDGRGAAGDAVACGL